MSMLKRQNKLAALLSAFDAFSTGYGYGDWMLPDKDGIFHDGSVLEPHCYVEGDSTSHGLEYSDDGTVEGLARWWIKQQLAD